jgi:probable HAF family extracellular repeat protein
MRPWSIAAILFCLLAWGTPILAAQPKCFKVTTLPEWQGRTLEPHAMNDQGQVVGLIRPDAGQWHLFLWERQSGVQDLGPVYPKPCDINNRGQIVGTMYEPGSTIMRAFLREPDGTVEILGSPDGLDSEATAINNRSQVVGRSFVARPGVYHAFIWDRTNGIRDLGATGGRASAATAISETGQVFGFIDYWESVHLRQRACYWDLADSFNTDAIQTPSNDFYSMNGNGWIVGKYAFLNGGPYVVLWQSNAGIQKLFSCVPDEGVFERSTWMVNDVNQVVCIEEKKRDPGEQASTEDSMPQQRRYFWDPAQGKISLDGYLPPQAREFTVRDLNNRGCILGIAHLEDGTSSLPMLLELTPARN